ncbi:MAG: YkgJ family cysteine cluster protein [Abitibacteriaceae bacterium]|nr:YkgJ family cysteine cluster protein [Abditibacteriaceae bacterium]MBV9865052.1 YkgJ family cysteine cluster protein [Abditibacteriaceae bacterium]
MARTTTDEQKGVFYDCGKCPAFCCSVYERVAVTKKDLQRLAKYFKVTVEEAGKRFTRMNGEERVLRRAKDPLLGEACHFLDRKTRGCTIYHARPDVCRTYPARSRCAYYDLLQFEREQQSDQPNVIPLVTLTFPEVKIPDEE